MLGFLLIGAVVVVRVFFGALVYFFLATAAMIVFAIMRRRFEFSVIKWAPVIIPLAEVLLLFSGIGHAGHIVGSASATITALLVLGDEKPKQALINRLGLHSAKDRKKVRSVFFTYGQVDKLEKLELGASYITFKGNKILFTVKIRTGERVLMEIDSANVEETYMRQNTSKNPVHYPSLRDLFLPPKKMRTIGKPLLRDYFLVIRTKEDEWTFFEEPTVLMDLQEEIERRRGLPPPTS